jgi:SAM-dependent methyltransferase
MGSSPSWLDPIVLPLIRGECVLDVACGYGRWGCLLRTNYFECGLAKPPIVDALDAFAPTVEYVQKLGVYRKVWQAELPCELPRGVYDTILASEIVEHLTMDTALKVMDEMEKAARQRVIITTPNWEWLRDGGETFLGMNEYEHHLSYISADLLRRRGYKIYGAGFGNPRTYSVKFLVHTLRLFGVRDFSALHSLSKNLPSLAYCTVAMKETKGTANANA